MTLLQSDIMQRIADTLDPEEIIDRLGMTSETICVQLQVAIMSNLDAFDDIYSDDTEGL